MFKTQPKLVSLASDCFNRKQSKFSNCLKGCKWSPDGTCLLVNSQDHRLRLFNTPALSDNAENVNEMRPELEMSQSQIIYDFVWYPLMNSADYATCFLLCTSKNMPIQLIDAYMGNTTSTYYINNYADELMSARSVAFLPAGDKFMAGYEKSIIQFDVQRPGLSQTSIANVTSGIISCLASTNELLATGSYNKSIGLYDLNSFENIAVLQGQKGGVTHLLISPDGNCLYSGGRKDSEILCWDLRNLGTTLHVINRVCTTNQRLYFDVHFGHNILATGDDNGDISLYDLSAGADGSPMVRYKSNDCCVNGVNFHPTQPLIASSSGHRVLLDFDDNNEDVIFDFNKSYKEDHNLKLWWFGEPAPHPVGETQCIK